VDRSQYSILIVDDSDANRYVLERSLRAQGYGTMRARSGAQALEYADYASAVVLDVHLPDIHGFEVCRMVRTRFPAKPIVHISALYVDPPHQEAGLAAGADRYFVSPVEPAELVRALDELLSRPWPAPAP